MTNMTVDATNKLPRSMTGLSLGLLLACNTCRIIHPEFACPINRLVLWIVLNIDHMLH